MSGYCSVPGCKSVESQCLSFYSFPSMYSRNGLIDPLAKDRREKWKEVLIRAGSEEANIESGVVCSRHFVEGKPASLLYNAHPDWVPSQNLDLDSCESLIVPKSMQDKNPNISELKKRITLKNIEKVCRLCLNKTPISWLFFSVLTFEDQSTLDISYVFQKATGESTEEINNPKLPQFICNDCVQMLVNVSTFLETYAKSCKALKEYRLKEESEVINFVKPQREVISEKVPFITRVIPNGKKKDEILHRCPICLEKFTALALKIHIRSHNSLKSYLNAAPTFNKKVRFCAQPRKTICLYNRENIKHTCPYCYDEFDVEEFMGHIKLHRKEENFRCNVCNRIFIGRNHLKVHQLVSHKKEKPYQCNHCEKGFFKKYNFECHKLNHLRPDNLPFKCQHCPKAYANPENLKRHNFSHEKSMSYNSYYRSKKNYVPCKECKQKFRCPDQLKKHTCQFFCSKCHKLFATKELFRKHTCPKLKSGPQQCNQCGKVYQLRSSFLAHQYRCSRKILCYVCGKNVTNLTVHMFNHFSQRRKVFTCSHCDAKFRYHKSLLYHIKSAHETQFQCQYCTKQFKKKCNLQVHERIHIGDKKHACNLCHKTFLEKHTLREHILKMHIEKDCLILGPELTAVLDSKDEC